MEIVKQLSHFGWVLLYLESLGHVCRLDIIRLLLFVATASYYPVRPDLSALMMNMWMVWFPGNVDPHSVGLSASKECKLTVSHSSPHFNNNTSIVLLELQKIKAWCHYHETTFYYQGIWNLNKLYLSSLKKVEMGDQRAPSQLFQTRELQFCS